MVYQVSVAVTSAGMSQRFLFVCSVVGKVALKDTVDVFQLFVCLRLQYLFCMVVRMAYGVRDNTLC